MRIGSGKLYVSSEEKCLQRRLETVQGRRVANGARQPVPCRRTCDDECTSAELCHCPLNYKVAASRRPSSTFNAGTWQLCSLFATLKGTDVWLRLRRLVTCFFGAMYKYTYLLTLPNNSYLNPVDYTVHRRLSVCRLPHSLLQKNR